MTLKLLGTGTSQGVPVIGCDCTVCRSTDPRDKRLRQSALLSFFGKNILIDAGPDLRQQLLRIDARSLEAILITHEHVDHCQGFDDVRPFNFSTGRAMPVFAMPRVIGEIRHRFHYIFGEKIPGLPELELIPLEKNTTLDFGEIKIEAFEVMHGPLPILGFRIGDLAYITDCKTMGEAETGQLRGIKTLVINALHHRHHHAHLNLREALLLIEKIKPEAAYLVHLSHHMGLYAEVNEQLPAGVRLAFDGLEIGFSV